MNFKPNKKQQECITNIDGKYLVLAGPGTGKTFTVIQRLKAMLDKGIEADKILCLSYSDAAANEMRRKITQFFGVSDLGVNIYTYHSFCNEIIAQNIESFGISDGYRIISDTVSKQFIKECIDEYNPTAFRNDRNDPYVYFKQIKKGIEEIKRNRISKTQYFKNIKENPDYEPQIKVLELEREELIRKENPGKRDLNRIEKIPSCIEDIKTKIKRAEEIWDYYELYKTKMEKEQYIDFDDMIEYVLDKFESSPAFLDRIANKYDYIMVDEYQDTNKNQNQIVFDLVHALSSQNVFVVGDDDQIIYSFQGANLETIERFLKEFPDTKVVCLEDNMRSTQKILDVARIIAKQDERRLEINPEFQKYNIKKDLIAKNTDLPNQDIKPRLKEYYNQEQEYIDIVHEIEQLVDSEDCPVDKNTKEKKLSEIAVLMTGNSDIEVFAQLLKDRNIPVEIKYGTNIFEIKSVIVMYYYLQTLISPELYSNLLFKLLLLPPFNFNAEDYKILFDQYSFGKSFIETMRENYNWKDDKKITNFLNTYDNLREFASSESIKNIVMQAGAKTGIFDYFLNEEFNKCENIAGLKKFIDEAKDFSLSHNKITLEDFIEYLHMVENDMDLQIRVDKPDIELNAVQISTYHSAKGKEYEYVYMPSLQSSKWESSSNSFKPSIPVNKDEWKDDDYWKLYKISDAVKKMYVGMTRAKHTLRLSYVETNKPSVWILEAKKENKLDVINLADDSLQSCYLYVSKNLTKREYDYKRDFKEQIEKRLYDKYYSASSINEYIKCPRMFLYQEILKFSGISGNPNATSYGRAVHKALQFMVDKAIENNNYPSKEEFIKEFKKELDTQPTSSYEQRQVLIGRGENELDRYYPILTSTPITSLVKSECELKTEIDGIKFKGYIDLVTKKDDGTYKLIDYKTGKYPTLINIAPDKEHEDYYNQLCLYKYYFEKINNAKVTETGFVYTLKPDKPIFKDYTQDEMTSVIDKFKNAVKEIETHNFEPSYNKMFCQYCEYKDFCAMDVV